MLLFTALDSASLAVFSFIPIFMQSYANHELWICISENTIFTSTKESGYVFPPVFEWLLTSQLQKHWRDLDEILRIDQQ